MDEKREIRLGEWQIKHQPNLNAKKTVEQIKETYTHSEDWQEFEVLLNRITELENQNSNRLDAIVKPEIAEIARQKYEFIIKNREKILEAFIAETGLLPSECTMIEQEISDVNFIGTKIYFVKRKQFSV